jgi:hypothetical protein
LALFPPRGDAVQPECSASGALICGYDTGGASEVLDLDSEPERYQAVDDNCGVSQYGEAFLSPSQLIEANHF